jgi:hypothetical protein
VGIAQHDSLACLYSLLGKDMPCVVLWERCNALNIVPVLVHESIHHALFWLDIELRDNDMFDEIYPSLREQRRLRI